MDPVTMMTVRVTITKLIVVAMILYTIGNSQEDPPSSDPFFADQKWQLKDGYEILVNATSLIILYSILFPLWLEGPMPSFVETFTWGMVSAMILSSYLSHLVRKHNVTWVNFGIDKKRFLRSGIPALNIFLGYFALIAAGVRVTPLNFLAGESNLLNSWLDTAIIGFALVCCEELLFRGILYAPVARRIGKWGAISVLSAVECLLFHAKLDVLQSCILFIIFVIFYVFYIQTQSLWASLILHIGINVPLWQPMSMTMTSRYFSTGVTDFLYIFTPLLILVITDIWWLINLRSRNKHRLSC